MEPETTSLFYFSVPLFSAEGIIKIKSVYFLVCLLIFFLIHNVLINIIYDYLLLKFPYIYLVTIIFNNQFAFEIQVQGPDPGWLSGRGYLMLYSNAYLKDFGDNFNKSENTV